MTKEDKNILLRLLQQHKELGISEQIDYLVDILDFVADRSATEGDACQSKKGEFTTEQIVSHFSFNTTTAKRYLRQLTEFGYLEAHGGNKNRTYSKHL